MYSKFRKFRNFPQQFDLLAEFHVGLGLNAEEPTPRSMMRPRAHRVAHRGAGRPRS